jgi:3-oxoadipate enol-lactonase
MARHAEDLAALLDHLSLGSCHLVGTSYGAEVAMILAADQPQRVLSLTVVAAAASLDPTLALKVRGWAAAAAVGPAHLARAVAADSYSDPFLAANPGLVELTARRLGSLPPAFFDGFSRLVGAFMDLELRDIITRIACPTLVVAAEEDRLKPLTASRVIAEGIPGARLVTVAGAGHAVVVEQPQVIAALALGFMALRPAPAG